MKIGPQATAIVKANMAANVSTILIGDVGIGKSSFVEDLAVELGTKSFSLACNLLSEKADLTGARLVSYEKTDGTSDYKQQFYPHARIVEAIDYALDHPDENPFLFMDEINRTESDVTSGVLTLITERRIGGRELPPNLKILAAGNDKGNIIALDEASVTRFCLLRVTPDVDTFLQIEGPNINRFIKKPLNGPQGQDLLFERPRSQESALVDGSGDTDDDDAVTINVDDIYSDGSRLVQLTTPRTISYLSRAMNALGEDELFRMVQMASDNDGTKSMLEEYVQSFIGNTKLAAAVVGEVFDASQKPAQTQQSVAVPRPALMDDLDRIATTTVTDLDAALAAADRDDLQACLVYALQDAKDRSRLVDRLAHKVPMVENQHLQTLVMLAASGKLVSTNIKALDGARDGQGNPTPIGQQLGMLVQLGN